MPDTPVVRRDDDTGETFTDIDPIGDISAAIGADEAGWFKDAVYYGDGSPGDDALSSGYLAGYGKGDLRVDLVFFVTTAVNGDGTFEVQCMATIFKVDEDEQPIGDRTEIDYSYPFDFSAGTYEEALRWARNAALADERFKFHGATI